MSKVDSHSPQPPVNPGSVVAGGAHHSDAVPAQGKYNDHLTVSLDEFSSPVAVSANVSETSVMVDLDTEEHDGQGQVPQRLMAVPVRIRDVARAPSSSRLDALQRNIDNCVGKNSPCSRDLQSLLGISATLSGIGMIGLSPHTPAPYAWIIGSVGAPLFLAGATMLRYAAEKQ